jgi:uncharacterized protein YdaU (DUF1376 family)
MADIDAWMPLWIGPYLADTTRFTTEQHGAYLLIIMDYWRSGAPPDDDTVLAQIARASAAAWRKLRPVLAPKFDIVDGYWRHRRIERELADAKARKEADVARATRGAEARWKDRGKHPPRNASSSPPSNAPSMHQAMLQGMPGQCSTPTPLSSDVLGSGEVTSTARLPKTLTKATWASWKSHLASRGKALSPQAESVQLHRLGEHADPEKVVLDCLANSWVNLPPIGGHDSQKSKPKTLTETRAETAAAIYGTSHAEPAEPIDVTRESTRLD